MTRWRELSVKTELLMKKKTCSTVSQFEFWKLTIDIFCFDQKNDLLPVDFDWKDDNYRMSSEDKDPVFLSLIFSFSLVFWCLEVQNKMAKTLVHFSSFVLRWTRWKTASKHNKRLKITNRHDRHATVARSLFFVNDRHAKESQRTFNDDNHSSISAKSDENDSIEFKLGRIRVGPAINFDEIRWFFFSFSIIFERKTDEKRRFCSSRKFNGKNSSFFLWSNRKFDLKSMIDIRQLVSEKRTRRKNNQIINARGIDRAIWLDKFMTTDWFSRDLCIDKVISAKRSQSFVRFPNSYDQY